MESFGWLNTLVLCLYFIVLAGMGFYFSKRQRTTDDFFKGGQRIPWWAAGLSIFGTALSAITFMAIPAKTYATDWAYFMYNMGILVAAPIIVYVFIPFYRKLNLTTAYEYLEHRFNLATRLIGSFSFMLFQIGRMGIVLYLPAIALNIATGIDILTCILLMGILSVIYTSLGGLEAVIWTDVLQVIVLLGGAMFSLMYMLSAIPDGFQGVIQMGTEQNKFNVFDFEMNWQEPVFWTVLIGSLFANITMYGTDQTMVQRYLSVKDEQAAQRTVWTNAWLSVPASLLFFFIGTSLFVFYQTFPDLLNSDLQGNDGIFPWYIISQLPQGLSGLLIAGIFAASMSSLSSSINSAATAYMTDVHQRFGWKLIKDELTTAKWISAIVGLFGIGFAVMMTQWEIKSLWDEFTQVLGLITGGLGGVFLLGILVKRADGKAAIFGLAVSTVVQYLMGMFQPVHLLLFPATGVISCLFAGWIWAKIDEFL